MQQWYTNKDLYEMIDRLERTLQDTNEVVRKYNGLYEQVNIIETKLDDQLKRCDTVQAKFETKQDMGDALLKIWPILISTVIFILSLIGIL